jgi:hypothetical protein
LHWAHFAIGVGLAVAHQPRHRPVLSTSKHPGVPNYSTGLFVPLASRVFLNAIPCSEVCISLSVSLTVDVGFFGGNRTSPAKRCSLCMLRGKRAPPSHVNGFPALGVLCIRLPLRHRPLPAAVYVSLECSTICFLLSPLLLVLTPTQKNHMS